MPILCELLQTTKDSVSAPVNLSCPTVTRAQAKAGLQPLPDLESSLLQGGTKGPRKSRRQWRLEKYLGTPACETSVEGLDASGWRIPENISKLQRGDESLKPLFEKAECDNVFNLCKKRYVVTNGVLYLQANDVTRLIVPTCCRHVVLHLAHTVLWAGHLGQQKTYAHIHSRFHWPTLYTDVQTYCTICAICQRQVLCPSRAELPCNLSLSSLFLSDASLWTSWGLWRKIVRDIGTSWWSMITLQNIQKPSHFEPSPRSKSFLPLSNSFPE